MKIGIKQKILHFLFTTRCPVCGEFIYPEELFCDECSKKISHFTGEFSVPGAESYTAAFVYDKNISPAVILLKRGICGNADRALALPLAEKLKKNSTADSVDLILPVPMHKKAQRERGYNQAELIAKIIGSDLDLPVITDCVVKVRKTAAQKELDRIHRRTNLKGAFRVLRPELIRGKSVLVIDDICTTGSTLTELAEVLRKNGAKKVFCATACKTPLKPKTDNTNT